VIKYSSAPKESALPVPLIPPVVISSDMEIVLNTSIRKQTHEDK
jgi:hypothetical protein